MSNSEQERRGDWIGKLWRAYWDGEVHATQAGCLVVEGCEREFGRQNAAKLAKVGAELGKFALGLQMAAGALVEDRSDADPTP